MKLLVAIDDSIYSEACIRTIVGRPWPDGTEVRVLSVAGIYSSAALPDMGAARGATLGAPAPPVITMQDHAAIQSAARRTAERAVESLREVGVDAQPRIRMGAAGTEIVAEAAEWPADLILVGSHRRSALQRLLLGSVATHVVHHASCSVEVVRMRDDHG